MFYLLLEGGILRSPTLIVDLSIPSFDSVPLLLLIFGGSVRCTSIYTFECFLTNGLFFIIKCPTLSRRKLFVLKSILSSISIATPALLWLLFTWCIFIPYFNLFVSLSLKCVSCGHQMLGAIYFILKYDFTVYSFSLFCLYCLVHPLLMLLIWLYLHLAFYRFFSIYFISFSVDIFWFLLQKMTIFFVDILVFNDFWTFLSVSLVVALWFTV